MTNQCVVASTSPWQWQESELETIHCPICDSEYHQSIYKRLDSLDIVACQSCSFRFIQPQPSQRELNRFYEQGYFTGSQDFHQGSSYFAARKIALAMEQVTGWQFLKSQISLGGKSVLDLGCADGALLVLAQRFGASQVAGVEVSTEAAQYGRNHYGLNILEASADALPFPAQTFDVVTAFDLIEHVRQPKQLFQEVSRILLPNGVFIGGCPDMGCFDDWADEWTGICRNMEHLSYFDHQSLRKIAEQCNFQVLHLEYQGFPLALRNYDKVSEIALPSKLQKLFQPNVWVHNLWQKLRVWHKSSSHRHELLFVFKKHNA